MNVEMAVNVLRNRQNFQRDVFYIYVRSVLLEMGDRTRLHRLVWNNEITLGFKTAAHNESTKKTGVNRRDLI